MSYYKNLKIWQNARQTAMDIHQMTFEKLPKFELDEEGSQIRRSIKAVKSQIVEGFGRRRYKKEFIQYLTYASASCDTTIDHLENLSENGSLKDRATVDKIYENLTILAKQINGFIKSVEKGPKDKRNHETSKPDEVS